MPTKKDAYLIIAHGTRDPEGRRAFGEFLGKFRAAYPHRHIQGAFLSMGEPTVPQAVERCVQEGARQIFVIPLLFFSGRHAKEDIPRRIQEAKSTYPEIDFHYASPLAENPKLFSLLEEKMKTLTQGKMKGKCTNAV